MKKLFLLIGLVVFLTPMVEAYDSPYKKCKIKNGKVTHSQSFSRCYAKIKISDGGKYDGEFNNGYFEGRGTYIYPNGDVYEGYWNSGKYHGEGTLTLANGEKKIGEWTLGVFEDEEVVKKDFFCQRSSGKVYKSSLGCSSNKTISEDEFLSLSKSFYCEKLNGEIYNSNTCKNDKEITRSKFLEIKKKKHQDEQQAQLKLNEDNKKIIEEELLKPIWEVNLCVIGNRGFRSSRNTTGNLSDKRTRDEKDISHISYVPDYIFNLCVKPPTDRNSKTDYSSRSLIKTSVRFEKITLKDICARGGDDYRYARSGHLRKGCPRGYVLKQEYEEANLKHLRKATTFNELAISLGCGIERKDVDDCVRRYLPSIAGTGPMTLEQIEEVKKDKELMGEVVFAIEEMNRANSQSNEPSQEEQAQNTDGYYKEQSNGQYVWVDTRSGAEKFTDRFCYNCTSAQVYMINRATKRYFQNAPLSGFDKFILRGGNTRKVIKSYK